MAERGQAILCQEHEPNGPLCEVCRYERLERLLESIATSLLCISHPMIRVRDSLNDAAPTYGNAPKRETCATCTDKPLPGYHYCRPCLDSLLGVGSR